MCGDWHHAEDITQVALLTLYRVWPRINDETRDAYARKVLLRVYLDDRRRSWRSREQLTDAVPDNGAEPEGFEDRTLVLGALSGMAPKQQEVLVLRYLRDLSVEETAEELGVSTGTVKSQSARGLATLRKRLGPHFPMLVAAAATVAAIIAIVLGIAFASTPPGPVVPAVPSSETSTPHTTPDTTPHTSPDTTPGHTKTGEAPETTR
jgi:RNA polymerase sigma factor (sigma-70 family)